LNSVSEGQHAVLYRDDICLGGSEIINYTNWN
jgi:tRNA U34 2-thiouridine synthase MnmA/TrmU